MIMTVATQNKGTLNLRATPSTSGHVISQIPYGTKLDVERVNDNWYKAVYKENTGYVMGKFLAALSESSSTLNKEDIQKIYDSLKTTLSLIEQLLK